MVEKRDTCLREKERGGEGNRGREGYCVCFWASDQVDVLHLHICLPTFLESFSSYSSKSDPSFSLFLLPFVFALLPSPSALFSPTHFTPLLYSPFHLFLLFSSSSYSVNSFLLLSSSHLSSPSSFAFYSAFVLSFFTLYFLLPVNVLHLCFLLSSSPHSATPSPPPTVTPPDTHGLDRFLSFPGFSSSQHILLHGAGSGHHAEGQCEDHWPDDSLVHQQEQHAQRDR